MSISKEFGKICNIDANKIADSLTKLGFVQVNDMTIVEENKGYYGSVIPKTGMDCPEGCTYVEKKRGVAVMVNDKSTSTPLVFINGIMTSPDRSSIGQLKELGFKDGGNETWESGRFAGLEDDGKLLVSRRDHEKTRAVAEALGPGIDADAYVRIAQESLGLLNEQKFHEKSEQKLGLT